MVPPGPRPRYPLVAGVDGCRSGWLVATARALDAGDPEVVAIDVVGRFEDVVERVRSGELTAVAVDMPIGLARVDRRACDGAARAALGPRRSSVFPAPIRAVLDATDFESAATRSRAVSGRGLTIQTWNLIPKIREVDAAVDPVLQDRVREAHPELAIARLLGRPASFPKRTAAGRAERLRALEGLALEGLAAGADPPTPRGAAPDDVIDALALTTTAALMAIGQVVSLGDGSVDDRGLVMEILA